MEFINCKMKPKRHVHFFGNVLSTNITSSGLHETFKESIVMVA